MSRGGPTNIGWAFALLALLAIILSVMPAIAQAPDKQIIKPFAKCADGKCVMDQRDFERLQAFHADRLAALLMAGEMIDRLLQDNADLTRQLARDAAGCKGRRA